MIDSIFRILKRYETILRIFAGYLQDIDKCFKDVSRMLICRYFLDIPKTYICIYTPHIVARPKWLRMLDLVILNALMSHGW